jgi:hypothetical protein
MTRPARLLAVLRLRHVAAHAGYMVKRFDA